MTINPKLLEPTLLWENTGSWASGFSQQNITLNQSLANFNYFVVEYFTYFAANYKYNRETQKFGVGNPTTLYDSYTLQFSSAFVSQTTSTTEVARRDFQIVNNTTIKFADALYFRNGTRDDAERNQYLLPIAIYGTNIL